MKLLRFGPKGREKPGLLDADGRIRDLSKKISDIGPDTLAPAQMKALARLDPKRLPLVKGKPRLGPSVAQVGKIVAVGINYAAHGAETKIDVPAEPILFTKAITALSGPNDPVILPKGSRKGDWEVELAVVIGRKAQYVAKPDALKYIAGYSIMNDVSEREFQLERCGQWVKGKSFDTSAPLGPWLVTPDEVKDPQNLRIWLEVSGVRRQDGNTSMMIFGVADIIANVSSYMTLLPGDVIAVFLKPGDVMRLGVEGLGEQRQEVRAWKGRK
ncbi:MAG: fumarylacetoacetate hydrolase family protein [Rhodospirillales bacterium]|nr:fumarylacetoacetate hydrolase family protein [Rhodospirillales bacterium]